MAKRIEGVLTGLLAARRTAEQITNDYAVVWWSAIDTRSDFYLALRQHHEAKATQKARKTVRDATNFESRRR